MEEGATRSATELTVIVPPTSTSRTSVDRWPPGRVNPLVGLPRSGVYLPDFHLSIPIQTPFLNFLGISCIHPNVGLLAEKGSFSTATRFSNNWPFPTAKSVNAGQDVVQRLEGDVLGADEVHGEDTGDADGSQYFNLEDEFESGRAWRQSGMTSCMRRPSITHGSWARWGLRISCSSNLTEWGVDHPPHGGKKNDFVCSHTVCSHRDVHRHADN
jgi:hypothetical protein